MYNVISIINVKGGTGKTLTTINLGGQFAEQGHKVLLIDNDSQSNLSQILNVESEYSLYDLYSDSKVNFEDCIVSHSKNIDVVTNVIESAILEKDLHYKKNSEVILKEKFEKFKNDYDMVIIDNSPFLGICTTNAMVMSSHYLEVIDNSVSAIQGLNLVRNLVKSISDGYENDNLKLLGILRNNFDKKTIFSKQMNEVILDEYKDKIFDTIIYNSVKYKESVAMNKTIQEYSKKHSEPYKKLYYEIIKRIH